VGFILNVLDLEDMEIDQLQTIGAYIWQYGGWFLEDVSMSHDVEKWPTTFV
jgi:hypothetical protein